MDENLEKKTTEEKIEGENINTNSEQKDNKEQINEEIKENNTEKSIIEVEGKRKKGNYITGTIGAIIGACIAVIPLILRYMYARNNFAITIMAALATTLIAGISYLVYRLFFGKVGKKLPTILTIVSLLVITIVTTIICPMILLVQFEYEINFENWINLFSDLRKDVRASIIEDLIAGVIITIISCIVTSRLINNKIKKQVENNKIKLKRKVIDQSKIIKKACIGLNVLSKENTITKQELLNELERIYNVNSKEAKKYFKTCKDYKILKKVKGKYYYDDDNELSIFEEVGNKKIKRIPLKVKIIILIALLAIISIFVIIELNRPYILEGTDLALNIQKTQKLYGTEEEIEERFGEESARAYNFIVKDEEADKYDIYAQLIPKTNYIGYEFATIIQEERDYYAQFMGEKISEVFDKNFKGREFKCYTYSYGTEVEYRAYIWLYDAGNQYLWINLYTDYDVDMEQADNLIKNLFK